MSISIVATRRVDLSDFAEGWAGCYLLVSAMNPQELKQWQDTVDDKKETDAKLSDMFAAQLEKLLKGGVIINTDEDGKSSKYEIETADYHDVAEAIGLTFQQRALMVASGTYGLKGL